MKRGLACQILTVETRRHVVEVRIVWRPDRAKMAAAMEYCKVSLRKDGRPAPYGVCSYRDRKRGRGGKPARHLFNVFVSGSGPRCLNTLSHEMFHVAELAVGAGERGADLHGALMEGVLPYFAARWKGSRLTEMFERARVAAIVRKPRKGIAS